MEMTESNDAAAIVERLDVWIGELKSGRHKKADGTLAIPWPKDSAMMGKPRAECCLGVICSIEGLEIDMATWADDQLRFTVGYQQHRNSLTPIVIDTELDEGLMRKYGIDRNDPLPLTDRLLWIVCDVSREGEYKSKSEIKVWSWMNTLTILNDYTTSWSDAVIPAIEEMRDWWKEQANATR